MIQSEKVVYLATANASKKCTMPIQNWCLAMTWFTIQFDDILIDDLNEFTNTFTLNRRNFVLCCLF